MNLQRIEDLIRKYENGDTSLAEENELLTFFRQEDIPFQFRAYKEMFGFFELTKKETIGNPDFDQTVLNRISELKKSEQPRFYVRYLYPIAGIAASILLIIGLYFFTFDSFTPLGTYEDPEIAYAETKKILLNVSGNLNSGIDPLSNIKEINKGMNELQNIKTFDEGVKNLRKISVLDKSKDIITQKTNQNENN
ncbi:MAG: hypothetical protein K8S16_17880 [Bacteroidales bacterium]|nr:hypothetical protein [Bacteroidales bacterium]